MTTSDPFRTTTPHGLKGCKPRAERRGLRSTLLALAAATLTAALAACAGDTNPVRDLVAGVGAGPPPAKTPDFVEKTRPAQVDYIPIAKTTPERPTKPRTADEVKAAETAMDKVRTDNEAAAAAAAKEGASTPPPKPAAPR